MSSIRFEDPNTDFEGLANYDFDNPNLYDNCRFNLDPIFQKVEFNNFNIDRVESGAEGKCLGGVTPPIDLN